MGLRRSIRRTLGFLCLLLIGTQSWGQLHFPVPVGTGATTGTVYATLNPADKDPSLTLSGGNLTVTEASTSPAAVRATIGKSLGKWYWEVTIVNAPNFPICGVSTTAAPITASAYVNSPSGWGWRDNRFYNNSGTISTAFTTYANGDVLGFALDMGAGTLICYLNNVVVGVTITGITGTIYPTLGTFGGVTGTIRTCNFGQSTFIYSPPMGYNPGVY